MTKTDGSVFDAIYLAVAEQTNEPFEKVRETLLHRDCPDDSFWAAWDVAVSQAVSLFTIVHAETAGQR